MNRRIQLIPPSLSADHIKEKIVCIRGHRERIFNLDLEEKNNKLICHNYGQGGAGWTFLFGCVDTSIAKFQDYIIQKKEFNNKTICVVGAGCYGLLTAIELRLRGYDVRIVARDTNTIASHKAAGFFFPRPRKISTTHEVALFETIGLKSYKAYQKIINGLHPFIQKGAQILPAYFSPIIDPGFSPYIKQQLMPHPELVTIDFANGKMYDMIEYKTLFINALDMMSQLESYVQQLGISIVKRDVTSFDTIEESIIFNCTGLGAQKLAGDRRVIPVQGHLISLQNQPALEQLQYMINAKVVMIDAQARHRDELIYYAPKESGILGITFIRGQDSLTANYQEFERLLQRCRDYFGT